MILFIDKIGYPSLTAYSYTAPCTCIVVMVILDQPLIYSAYPYSYPRQTNSYLTAVT